MIRIPLVLFALSFTISTTTIAQQRPMTITDMMKFNQIERPSISRDGAWVAYTLEPDRGDGQGIVQSTKTSKKYAVPRGDRINISSDSRWVVMETEPPADIVEKKEKDKDKPRPGMVLIDLVNGDTLGVPSVQKFEFSENGKWLVYQLFKWEEKKDSSKSKDSASPKDKKNLGTDFVIRNLLSGSADTIHFVSAFAVDSTSQFLAYALADTSGKSNGVYVRNFDRALSSERPVHRDSNGVFTNLTWSSSTGKLAFVSAKEKKKENPGPGALWLWDQNTKTAFTVANSETTGTGWIVPSKNSLSWSGDGERLFFGMKPAEGRDEAGEDSAAALDFFSITSILKNRGVDVWHWNDPLIIPNQKNRWKEVKDQTFMAVYNSQSGKVVRLGDKDLPTIGKAENPFVALGRSDIPYLKEITWEGHFNDAYVVRLENGERTKIGTRLRDQIALSPNGKYVTYFQDGNWFLFDIADSGTANLTKNLGVSFADEENDTPSPPRSYGFPGWLKGDSALLLYDRYDIWSVPTNGGVPFMLTDGQGRKNGLTFRVQKMDTESRFFRKGETLLLTAYHDKKKFTAFYEVTIGKPGVRRLTNGEKKFSFIVKAAAVPLMLFTREGYNEFPDLWIATTHLQDAKQISNANPQIKDIAWGSAELVEWNDVDGDPLQGVLIKPGGYKQGARYPVLVYYYEKFSQRLHEFNRIEVNHRPCFPFYASNGYAVFLPDVKFEIGRPGPSATKSIVPGVQKLIDMGVADPKAIALHGHSWSGYQTAFVITQTNIFAAAIAGAPVSNMTSAYGGIRWESGLGRLFQYEEEQSRIGGSLWEYPERYIENSPVFFADRIKTPLLIQFGDEDGAVPWYQGIELYLAMRRLGKDCVFLEYRGEPHHLKQYPNKVDYTIKFKEYLDHYLKGAPAPEWLSQGVPYKE